MTSETSQSHARAQALQTFQNGSYLLAARLLASLLARDPDDTILLRLCGMALVRTDAASDALPYLARAVAVAPGDAIAATWYGIGLHAAGRHADAASALHAAASLTPDDPAPLIHLSRALLKQDRPQDAFAAAQRAVSLAPALLDAMYAERLCALAVLQASAASPPTDLAGAWLALGRICMRLDKVMDARAAFLEALGLQPLLLEAECELALVEHLCGQPLAATARLQAVLARDPGCLLGRIALASRLLLDDDAATALAVLNEGPTPPSSSSSSSSSRDPLWSRWHAERAQALIALGRNAAALREIAQAEQGPVRELELLLTWQRLILARRAARPEAAALADRVTRLTMIREAGTLEHRIDAHFDLADLRRAERNPAAAFGHWHRGHALLGRAQPFSRQQHELTLEAIVRSFDANRLARGPCADNRDTSPVFIVGLPRTGTTLLEQILSAHHSVHGAGERLAVRETLARLTGTMAAGTAMTRAACLDAATLTAASVGYLADLHAVAPRAARVLDKMPDNVFQLGFLATLLPGARVICCTRDLRDVGASIFQHRFIGYHPYAHELADLGWYIAKHQELLQHWRASLPSPMLMLDHGEWIADFGATLRRVLTFLDLPYDAACERFFEQDRRIGTASRTQVRRPINAAGVGRWRAYAEQLAPMLRELPPAC
ncbi:tetratricopeptide repeat-containing sulfotransferase family protein [Lichenicoccus sp.]|uniref:tetratricopeptide repeat-containing sulfotransferase family protein n=1 Tax=Lichenicoccus sp. TaxID=2781899 RepID=UPI003D0C0242